MILPRKFLSFLRAAAYRKTLAKNGAKTTGRQEKTRRDDRGGFFIALPFRKEAA